MTEESVVDGPAEEVVLNKKTAAIIIAVMDELADVMAKRDLVCCTIVTSLGYDPATHGVKQISRDEYRIVPYPKKEQDNA